MEDLDTLEELSTPPIGLGVSFNNFVVVSFSVLVLVLFMGDEKNQAVSWFDLGYFSFQPGEFIKIITIVFLADYYEKNKHHWKLVL